MARAPARTAVLITAHPDDESMFFAPTVQQLVASGHSVHVLCLSTGNAEGLGAVRSKELVAACRLLQIPAQNVHVVDQPQLQDGMRTAAAHWPAGAVQQQVRKWLEAHPAATVVTFDYYGVSAHPNHVALHKGVRLLLESRGRELGVVAAWQLVSLPRLLMFLGPLLLLLTLLMRSMGCWVVSGGVAGAKRSWGAMAAHHSQWVWYRRLFVAFSAYAYINFLRPMQIS